MLGDKIISRRRGRKRSSLATRPLSLQKVSVRIVNYLGPEGTFSHILARKRYGKGAVLNPCPTIEAVFERVLDSAEALGLVPIENSSGGTVYDSVDLLIRNAGRVFIREELALDVRIALLGHAGTAISTVYSHFVQIKHHADWLKERHPKARVRAVASTALAARRAAASKASAALASPGAADVYGLEVLELPSLGRTANVTHFFTIGREAPQFRDQGRKTALVAALPMSAGVSSLFWDRLRARKSTSLELSRVPCRVTRKPTSFFLRLTAALELLWSTGHFGWQKLSQNP